MDITRVQHVYDAAIARTSEVRATRKTLEEHDDDFVARVTSAKTKILTQILDEFEEKIMESADRGAKTADIFRFNGNDFVDDVSVLFVLKGHRLGAPPPPRHCPGPLFPDLCAMFAPFDIVHDWDGASAGNRIVARWL